MSLNESTIEEAVSRKHNKQAVPLKPEGGGDGDATGGHGQKERPPPRRVRPLKQG